MSERAWYLLYSKPHQELIAQENLERQGYITYLPMLETRRFLRGKHQYVVNPMFPRYLFLWLSDETDNWGPIRFTRGVMKLVRFSGNPAKVPSDLIDFLKENEKYQIEREREKTELKPGMNVRVLKGIMSGYEGVVQERVGKKRVTVLLEIVGKNTLLYLSPELLESV